MRALLTITLLLGSFTASASYTLSIKELSIIKADVKSSFENATVQYAGKRSVIVSLGAKSCLIKNVTFGKYDTTTVDGVKKINVKMIDEKTYNKVETCLE